MFRKMFLKSLSFSKEVRGDLMTNKGKRGNSMTIKGEMPFRYQVLFLYKLIFVS